ncbi:PEP-utilizing enzyme [Chitinimonas sp.]|uniref:PEP-utilizing enzyme n=1 Tax=Chitinimonas sp. TaxID=1934313 RepID=UPI0035B39BD5
MKPVLYLLAGNGSAADWWDDALPYFRHHEVRPLALPGFGDNAQPPLASLSAYADALLAATAPGSSIFAVGVNSLPVLHALARQPGHFSRTMLLAPVGVFLWQRRLPALMAPKPIRQLAHWLLSNFPRAFAGKFSRQRWRPEQYRRMGEGYRRCRAFLPYWDMVRADTALPLLEWISDPIELIWGGADGVVGQQHAAAWAAVLARADLRVTLHPGWGHYPWIDDPAGFASWLESATPGFVAHSKGGRLRLAALARLNVPPAISLNHAEQAKLGDWLEAHASIAQWAVRSSGANEDQADHANAGVNTSYLRLAPHDVPARAAALFADGLNEVVVQQFIEPRLSGIAFVRHLSVELEWVEGHLSALADGVQTPQRAVLSRLPAPWQDGEFQGCQGLSKTRLWQFLQAVLRAFHYVHGDVEWAWDGQQLWLLQYRPVTRYGWRRHITSANLDEILPPAPSRLMEYAQQRAAASIPAIMARWDPAVLADNEPFTVPYAGASYINDDLFLAQLQRFGISSERYAGELGGATPELPWRPLRLLAALPRIRRMQLACRAEIDTLPAQLAQFDAELAQLASRGANGAQLANWFCRFYLFVVQSNLCIGTALGSAGGSWLGTPPTVYRHMAQSSHRLPWETDPATARLAGPVPPLQPLPRWPATVRLAHHHGLPGMRAYYSQVREWFRDNLLRIFFRLHHAMPKAERADWFAPHPQARSRSGSFWQDGRDSGCHSSGFLIHGGTAEGVLGEDILLEASLDPGRYQDYARALGVVALRGGRLSHGATLLRELGKPAAIIPAINPDWRGRRVCLAEGQLSLVADTQAKGETP